MMDNRPMSRGSKQKIMKLKEELHQKSNTDPQNLRVHQLKESYDLAVLKMNEMNNAQASNLYVKVHGKRAGRAYSALSSIIYASIAAAKIEGLEVFIRQTVASLPANMIDLEEWNHVLNLARDCREVALQQSSLASRGNNNNQSNNPKIPPDFAKKFQLLYFLTTNPVRNIKDELIVFRKQIVNELSIFQQTCLQTVALVSAALQKLRDLANNDLNLRKIAGLKKELYELNEVMKQTQLKSDQAMNQRAQQYEQQFTEAQQFHQREKNSMKNDYEATLLALEQSVNEKSLSLEQLQRENEDFKKKAQHAVAEREQLTQELSSKTLALGNLQENYENLKAYSGKQTVDYLTFQLTNQIIEESIHNIESVTNEKLKTDYSDEIKQLKTLQQQLKDELADKNKIIVQKEAEILKLLEQQKQKDEIHAKLVNEHLQKHEATTQLLSDYQIKHEESTKQLNDHRKKAESHHEQSSQQNSVIEELQLQLEAERLKNKQLTAASEEFSKKSETVIQSLLENLEKEKQQSLSFQQTIESLEQQLNEQKKSLQASEEKLIASQASQEKKYEALFAENQAELLTLQEKLGAAHDHLTNSKAASLVAAASLASDNAVADQERVDYIHQLMMEKAQIELENQQFAEQLQALKETIEKYESDHDHDSSLILQLQNDAKHYQEQALIAEKQNLLDKIHQLMKDITNLSQQIHVKIQSIETTALPQSPLPELSGKASAFITSLEKLAQEVEKQEDYFSTLFVTSLQYSKNSFHTILEEFLQVEEQYRNVEQANVKAPTPVAAAVVVASSSVSVTSTRPTTPSAADLPQKIKSLEKERIILKDENASLLETKHAQEIIIKDLREEMNRMTNELILLKEQNFTPREKARAVGFVDSPEVFVFNSAVSSAILQTDSISSDETAPKTEKGQLVPETTEQTVPKDQESIKTSPRSANTSGSLDNNLQRNAAYYEAQRVVLDAIKTGLMSFLGTNKQIGGPSTSIKTSPRSEGGSVKSVSPRGGSDKNAGKGASSFSPRSESKNEEKKEEVFIPEPVIVLPAVTETQPIDESLAIEQSKPNKERKPFLNPFKHLNMEDPFTRSVVKLQATARSFVARARVRRIHVERRAVSQGILIACYGTVQGETGWYTSQDQLFYFCAQQDEFLLLCGPITQDIYELALEDLLIYLTPSLLTPTELTQTNSSLTIEGIKMEGSLSSTLPSNSNSFSVNQLVDKYRKKPPKFPKNIEIDHLGLQATRIQIETLLHDISLRDHYINEYELQLQQCTNLINQLQEENVMKQYENDKLFYQLKESQERVSQLDKHVQVLYQQYSYYANKQLDGTKSTIEVIQQKTSDLLLQSDLYERNYRKKFTALTAIVRGYLSRQRVKRIRQYRQAEETGVLLAMKNTIQGETGWYIGPNGSIFYFVLKDGKWIYTAGPLTETDFRIAYLQSKTVSNSLYQKQFPQGKLLTRCSFKLNGLLQQLQQQIQFHQQQQQQLLTTSDTNNGQMILLPPTTSSVDNQGSAIPGGNLEGSLNSGRIEVIGGEIEGGRNHAVLAGENVHENGSYHSATSQLSQSISNSNGPLIAQTPAGSVVGSGAEGVIVVDGNEGAAGSSGGGGGVVPSTSNPSNIVFFPTGVSGQLYYYYEMFQLLEQSDVYLSNQNHKLYLSIPMDEFVYQFIDNQQQFGMNESTVNSLFSPESSRVLNSNSNSAVLSPLKEKPGEGEEEEYLAVQNQPIRGGGPLHPVDSHDNSSIESNK